MSVDEDLRTKYEFILRPIKDLTKNWEVDVSQILEKYMGDIEKLSFTVNNGDTAINFAEASLLIQGTTCVWGRKVEYLHMLIKKSLEMIVNKQSAPGQLLLEAGNSTVDHSRFDDEEGCQLLRLDDLSIISQRLMTGKADPVSPIPIPPSSLLELDADERGQIIIMEDKSDTVCYSNDFWVNHYIPFLDRVSSLDRDSKSTLSDAVVYLNDQTDSTMTPIVERLPESDFEPVQHDDSMEDIQATPPRENESSQHSNPAIQLRPRSKNNISTASLDVRPVLLDPYEECAIFSWADKKFRKSKSRKLPPALLAKSTKRKHDGSTEKQIEPINDFLNRFAQGQSTNKCESNPLMTIMDLKRKRSNEIWKSIKDLADSAQQQFCDVEEDDNENDIGDECHEDFSFSNVQEDSLDNGVASTDAEPEQRGSYEDLVRNVVDNFYFSAQRYKEETALAQRVKQWDEVVTPCLQQQNQRPVFDIHKYGDIILEKFGEEQETKLFQDVVDSVDSWHICRLFAATLQLANDNNFCISAVDDLENSINSMELSLLSKQRLCNRFDDYTYKS